jgi:hypothetical protein
VAQRKLDVVVVRWYERLDRSPDVVPRWLAAARDHLPEATPRRYGDSEPLRGRFDRDGEAGLTRAYAEADSLLFLAGTPPVFHASLSTRGTGRLRGGPVGAHTLHAELDPADERLHRFALALTHPGTIYVSASVSGGETLDRGTLYGPGDRPAEPYLAPLGFWLGLPPTRPAWHFFGTAYTRALPADLGTGWVPERFQARLQEDDIAQRHAPRLPRGLGRSRLRFW